MRASVKRLLMREGFTREVYEHLVGTIMEQAISLYHDYTPMSADFSFSMGIG